MTSEPLSVPSPALVGAWSRLDMLRSESVPMWAAHWIVDGMTDSAVVDLAAADASDGERIRRALPDALTACGVNTDMPVGDAVTLVFDDIAGLVVSGRASWRWAIKQVGIAFVWNDWPDEFRKEPLAALYSLDDELVGVWGRNPDAVRFEVEQACTRQLNLRPRASLPTEGG